LQGFLTPHGFAAAHGLLAAQGLSAAQGFAAAAHGLQLASLGAHGLHDAAQGLQLATLVAPAGSGVPPAFLAATGLAMPCAAVAAAWSDTPAAASPPAPIVSPRATVAAPDIRECVFDVIMSSVIGGASAARCHQRTGSATSPGEPTPGRRGYGVNFALPAVTSS
jgi:hypothetical protein